MQVVDDMIQDDDNGVDEDLLAEKQDIQQQGEDVSIEAQVNISESLDTTKPIPSIAEQDVTECVQLDNAPPETLPSMDSNSNSELRETSDSPLSSSAAVHVSLNMHITVEPLYSRHLGTIWEQFGPPECPEPAFRNGWRPDGKGFTLNGQKAFPVWVPAMLD